MNHFELHKLKFEADISFTNLSILHAVRSKIFSNFLFQEISSTFRSAIQCAEKSNSFASPINTFHFILSNSLSNNQNPTPPFRGIGT